MAFHSKFDELYERALEIKNRNKRFTIIVNENNLNKCIDGYQFNNTDIYEIYVGDFILIIKYGSMNYDLYHLVNIFNAVSKQNYKMLKKINNEYKLINDFNNQKFDTKKDFYKKLIKVLYKFEEYCLYL